MVSGTCKFKLYSASIYIEETDVCFLLAICMIQIIQKVFKLSFFFIKSSDHVLLACHQHFPHVSF